ncbi:hypothetical protein BTJ40_05340 [Microbulbifer sp. A4B17]|nr:hypothetical protein BTJ40_05340 [Microbulbifer sp. A4B17]
MLTPLIKQLTEVAMKAELEKHLTSEDSPNHKNGSTSKTMESPAGSFKLQTPRERAGTFESQVVKKHQAQLTDELERKVIALFALDNSYQDIRTRLCTAYPSK